MSAEAEEILERFAEQARNCRHLVNGEVDDVPRNCVNFTCLNCGRVHSTITREAMGDPAIFDLWISQCAEIYHRLIQAAKT